MPWYTIGCCLDESSEDSEGKGVARLRLLVAKRVSLVRSSCFLPCPRSCAFVCGGVTSVRGMRKGRTSMPEDARVRIKEENCRSCTTLAARTGPRARDTHS